MQPTRTLLAEHKKNLLICLDAFGTLFAPKEPISVTYAHAAFRHGLPTGGAKDADEVMKNFKRAFKGETRRNSNYGRSTGMGAERWWSNVSVTCTVKISLVRTKTTGYNDNNDPLQRKLLQIHFVTRTDVPEVINHTFQPFLRPKEKVPRALITELYQKFATKEAYYLFPDVKDFFLELHKYKITRPTDLIKWPYEKVIVGVITNSDNRVPGILQSFGLEVASRRFGLVTSTDAEYDSEKDVDFVVMSYDVGHEKPDRQIFNAATSMLTETLVSGNEGLKADDFEKLYVGDDLEKDFDGARAAGWEAVLLDRSGMTDKAKNFQLGPWGLKDRSGSERKVLAAKSLLDLYQWRATVTP